MARIEQTITGLLTVEQRGLQTILNTSSNDFRTSILLRSKEPIQIDPDYYRAAKVTIIIEYDPNHTAPVEEHMTKGKR